MDSGRRGPPVRMGVRMEGRNVVDLRANARDDERRRREEATVNALQQQVDELRHLLREQLNRQGRIEEQLRLGEAQLGQVRAELDDVRQETGRAGQLRQLDEHRVRQQMAELQSRVEEPQRPLRALQAQMAELIDQLRQEREQVTHGERQVEAVRVQVEGYRNDIARALETARLTREALDGVHQAQSALAREIQKVGDRIHLVEQEARRRMAEVEQAVANVAGRIDEVASYRPGLEESIRQARDELAAFQPQLDALGTRYGQQMQALARVQAQAEERDGLIQGRVEEVRTALTEEIGRIMDAVDEAVDGIHTRITAWEEGQRELNGRLSQTSVQIGALQGRDDRLAELLRRTEERLVLQWLEQAQQAWEALMERRQGESGEDA